MSLTAPLRLPRRTTAPAPDRSAQDRHLRAVERPNRFRASSIGMPLAVLGVVLIAQLILSMVLIQGAYREDDLQGQVVELQREHTAAAEQVDALTSPQHLAQLATNLGMVPGAGSFYLDVDQQSLVTSGGASAPQRSAIDPTLVTNAALDPNRDRPGSNAKPNTGAPSEAGPAADVPSEFELAAPDTH